MKRHSQATAIDGHVHFYPQADIDPALRAARANLQMVWRHAGRADADLCLLLTETARDDAFGILAERKLVPKDWWIRTEPEDPAVLWADPVAGRVSLLLVVGRQIVSAEGVEVLALATAARLADGPPVRALLSNLRDRRISAVLPWGLGNWMGACGKTIAALLAETDGVGLLPGDNAGWPVGWMTPRLLRAPDAAQVPVLPGTDPLPLVGAEARIGRYGFLLPGPLGRVRPAEDLRRHLFDLPEQPLAIGGRRRQSTVIVGQVDLRRRGRRAPPVTGQGTTT